MGRRAAGLLVAGVVVLGGCGSEARVRPGPFEAQRLAALPGGGLAVAGTEGACGETLVVRRFAADGAEERGIVEAGELGGDCVRRATALEAVEGGALVAAVELDVGEGGPFESTVVQTHAIVRLDPELEPDEDFGVDGVLTEEGAGELSGSVAVAPDGRIADAEGRRFDAEGEEEPRLALPGAPIPGEAEVAAAADGGWVIAASERGGRLLVARFSREGATAPAVSRVPPMEPARLDVDAAGVAYVLGFAGELLQIPPVGGDLVPGSFGRFGKEPGDAAVAEGGLWRAAREGGRLLVSRELPDGAPDPAFGAVMRSVPGFPEGESPAGAPLDVEVAPDGRALVLADVVDGTSTGSVPGRIVAFTRTGRRAPVAGGRDELVLAP